MTCEMFLLPVFTSLHHFNYISVAIIAISSGMRS